MTPIEGKVARVINSLIIALNIGKNKGVKEGMKFKILTQEININDPDSREEIGKIYFVKARVSITQVEEKFCLAKSDEIISSSFLPTFIRPTKVKALPVEGYQTAVDGNINIGDKAVQIEEIPKESDKE